MGIFNNLFNGSSENKETNALPWMPLTDLGKLEEIKHNSNTKTQLIFKHSTRCGISRMVLKQFEGAYAYNENDFDLYFLDLLNHRDISNDIAAKFQVMHQSPQLLVIKNGVVVASDSHSGINNLELNKFI